MRIKEKKIVFYILFILITTIIHAKPSNELTIYSIRGPSSIGMIRLFDNPPQSPDYKIKMETVAQADLLAAKFISGEAKIGILTPNLAAKIASSGIGIQIAAVTGTGMLSLLSADPSVQSFDDLKGREIDVAGQGSAPDYVFRKILLSRGIDPDKDVNLRFSLALPEIAQALIAGRITLAVLPEPFSTMARLGNSNIAVVDDIQEEWNNLTGGESAENYYPITVLAVNSEFASKNRQLINSILESKKDSIEWVKAHPAEAGELVEKQNLGLRAQIAREAIPGSNYVFITALEARPSLENLFRVFLEFAPVSIGGVIPGDNFYFQP